MQVGSSHLGIWTICFVATIAAPARAADLAIDRIIPDPAHPAWLKHKNGKPFYMCGPGDPEGFLYRGERKPDGTRDGDQMKLIRKLAGTGANCIYLMAVRSHGGDGNKTQNPFEGNDPRNKLNDAVLKQWEEWFQALDDNGIVTLFILYDDDARPFGKELPPGGQLKLEEARFIDEMVRRFKHHQNWIWCVAEEYAEGLSRPHALKIAERLRQQDDLRHAISIHQLNGTSFDFVGQPVFDQFAMQWNVDTPEALHKGVVTAWNFVKGRVNINLAEFTDSHYRGKSFAGTGDVLRHKIWAIALGGGYSMILGMDIASTPLADLQACGRLVAFMETTRFNEAAPHDELARADTQYVLAHPGQVYLAYAATGRRFGLAIVPGRYRIKWYDPRGGEWIDEGVKIFGEGEAFFDKPASIPADAALYLESAQE